LGIPNTCPPELLDSPDRCVLKGCKEYISWLEMMLAPRLSGVGKQNAYGKTVVLCLKL
jgi:hypothetical protein